MDAALTAIVRQVFLGLTRFLRPRARQCFALRPSSHTFRGLDCANWAEASIGGPRNRPVFKGLSVELSDRAHLDRGLRFNLNKISKHRRTANRTLPLIAVRR
jgi:hypothetical protein